MQVQTIRSTPNPERLVCQAARGDYYDGFVGDVGYDELMESVEYNESHETAVREIFNVDSINGYTTIEYDPNDDLVYDIVATDEADNIIDPETVYRQYALLERLFRRNHWGPAEHPQITLAVEGISRSCMAQLTRHRLASFDVQSMRYVDFSDDASVFVPDSMDPDSETFSRETGPVELDGVDPEYVLDSYEDMAAECIDWYERMVDHGVPKEDARMMLPIGTKVNLTVSLNARTLLHIEDMRGKADAQSEIRRLTDMVHDEFQLWMPMTAHLYDEHGPNQVSP